jgi:glycosyltransferase involved in cell wall biosynthesis
MKLLLSAVGCDPFGGSEGIYGWYVVNALAKEHDCHVITEIGYRKNIEEATKRGLVSPGLHFRYLGTGAGYHPNRLIARMQSWGRYQQFQQDVLSLARAWHEEVDFDIAQHVTYTSWRVPSPLWQLGIPFVWGPISGTEIFPRSCMSSLSPSAWCFETLRLLQTSFARRNKNILACARHAAAIPAPHQQAVDFLTQLRGSSDGVTLCHNFFFPDTRIHELNRNHPKASTDRPLRAFGAGNLEGRKGVAIALHAIAQAKARGVRVDYHVTSRGPELAYLKKLSARLGLSDQVILGERFEATDFAAALSTFDICLLPSLRDGAGLSIMEAMLAGCVPIVADWCGPAEFVTDECGYKVPVTKPDKMAQSIADILCELNVNRTVLDVKGAASRERIQSSYNEGQFLEAMNLIYHKALRMPEATGLWPLYSKTA